MLLTRGLRSHSKSRSRAFFLFDTEILGTFQPLDFLEISMEEATVAAKNVKAHDMTGQPRDGKKYCCDVAQKKNHLLNWDLDDRKFGKYFSLCLQN